MTVRYVRRARSLWLVGFLLVAAGFAPVALFVGAALLPAPHAAPVLQLFPAVPPEVTRRAETFLGKRRIAWRPSPHHFALPFAAIGLLVMAGGAAFARRQERALQAGKARKQDALRRAEYYRASERAEPAFTDVSYTTRRNETSEMEAASSAVRAAAAQR